MVNSKEKFETLRRKAEEVLQKQKRTPKKISLEINELIHELEVNQVELEFQNEDLIETQRMLEESRRNYYELYDYAPVGYFTLDNEGIIKKVNLTGTEILGIPRNIIVNSAFIHFIEPSHRKTFYDHLNEVRDTQLKGQCTLGIKSKNKPPIIVNLNSRIILDNNKNFKGYRTIITDVTEQKKVETLLRDSEEKFRSVIETAMDAIVIIEEDGNIILWNSGAETIFGYSADEAKGKPLTLIIPARNHENYKNAMKELMKTEGKKFNGKYHEQTGLRKDGSEIPTEMSLTQLKVDEKSYYTAIIRDITERKLNEEKIAEFNVRLQATIDAIPDLMLEIDEEGRFYDYNAPFELYLPPEKFLGKTVNDVYPSKAAHKIMEALKIAVEKGKHRGTVYELDMPDGKRYFELSISKKSSPKSKPHFIAMVRDITERKKAEIALHESEEKFRTILESSPDSITVSDLDMKIIECNQATVDMHHAHSKEEIKGLNALELVDPNDVEKLKQIVRQVLSNMEIVTFEVNLYKQDGTLFPAEISGNVIVDSSNEPIAFVAITKDITRRKKADEQIKQSLKEKEMLLKEIHHRVKNNLMIISSLLNLQSQYIKDKASLDIFKESQNRARSMALIHEKLYQTTDLKRIDFGDYIRTIVNELFKTFNVDTEQIKLIINVEDIFLDINSAIPLGLIVNELITNCFKYAFPEDESGEIIVDFRSENDEFILTVSDTGIGFPEDLDFKNTSSLGLQLVNNLTDQIDGEVELDTSIGTEFKVKFKELDMSDEK